MVYPALRLLMQVVIGIWLGHTFPSEVLAWGSVAALLLGLAILGLLLEKKYPSQLWRASWMLSYLLGVPAAVAVYAASIEQHVPPDTALRFANREVVALARAESNAKTKNRVAQWTATLEKVVVQAETVQVAGKVRVRRYQQDSSAVPLQIGETFWLQGKLEFPKAALNRGEFDYRAFLAEKGIDLLLVSSDRALFLKTGETKSNWLERWLLFPVGRAMSERIETLFPAGDERAFVKGIVLGDRSEISDEVRAAFQKTGTIHVLAISGLHVGLIALLLNLMLRRLKVTQVGKWVAFAMYGLALLYYSNLTGNSPPVKRAVLMAMLFELGSVLERKSYSLNTLAAAAVLMLLLNPRELFSLSFHLTNAAVAAILLIHPRISALYVPQKEQWRTRIAKYLWDALSLTIAASIGTAPFISHYFGSVPLLGLLANLLVTDMMSLALGATVLALLFDWLSPMLGEYYAVCAYYTIRGAITVAEFFSQIPLANVELKVSAGEIVLLFLAVATILAYRRPRLCAWLATGTLVSGTAWILVGQLRTPPEPVVIFNALGRGNSVILRTAVETVLIDAGTSERQWKRIEKQLQEFRCHTLSAFVQASSPPSVAEKVPAPRKMRWGDSALVLQSVVAYRPEPSLLKVISKSCQMLVALNPLKLRCADFFKADVALVRLKRFGEHEANALKAWINYADPKLVAVDLSAMRNSFERKRFYRFALQVPQIKTTERDGQIVVAKAETVQ